MDEGGEGLNRLRGGSCPAAVGDSGSARAVRVRTDSEDRCRRDASRDGYASLVARAEFAAASPVWDDDQIIIPWQPARGFRGFDLCDALCDACCPSPARAMIVMPYIVRAAISFAGSEHFSSQARKYPSSELWQGANSLSTDSPDRRRRHCLQYIPTIAQRPLDWFLAFSARNCVPGAGARAGPPGSDPESRACRAGP